MSPFSRDFAGKVFATVGTGLVVLAYELFWLFGPGWTLRAECESRQRRVAAVRERLAGSNNPTVLAELREQEAALAACEERMAEQRAAHLARMQQRAAVFAA